MLKNIDGRLNEDIDELINNLDTLRSRGPDYKDQFSKIRDIRYAFHWMEKNLEIYEYEINDSMESDKMREAMKEGK